MLHFLRSAWLLVLLIFACCAASAQVQTGTPPFGSFGGGPDVIDLSNLNSHISIPIVHKSGRGTDFVYNLDYESSIWYPVTSGGTTSWQPINNWGWNAQTAVATGYVTYSYTEQPCYDSHHVLIDIVVTDSHFVYHDPYGVNHSFFGSVIDPGECPSPAPQSINSITADGSGYSIHANPGTVATIATPTGTVFTPPNGAPSGASSFTDRNGNRVTDNGAGVFTDTLGTTALTVSTAAPSPTVPVSLTYKAPSGADVSYTIHYSTYTVQTKFNCGFTEYGDKGTTTALLISEIDLPDTSKYTFTYEATPGVTGHVTGRIASVTLPTGGTISYAYTGGNNGINCSDGSASTLTRSTPDGTWTYTQVKGTGAASTTTITDPLNNQTSVQFQGIYETYRQVYQGSATGTPLWVVTTCYNGNTSNCSSTAVTPPITQRRLNPQFGGSQLQAFTTTLYDSSGNLTEQDDFDYAVYPATTLLRKSYITYASLGNNINAFSQTVTVCSPTGSAAACNGTGTVVAQTTNSYDQTSVSASSGTPQHVGVSGSRGNLTTVANLTSGSNTLSKTFTYYDTGMLKTAVEANGATTTFNYQDATSTCGNAFPTDVSEPLSLARSMTWDCSGGVQLTSVDENSQTTKTTFNDPYFWRPAKIDYPDGGETSWTYNSPTLITATSKITASQNIVAKSLLDGLGRPVQSQLTSDPQGNIFQDTVYDSLGRVASVSNPYRSTNESTYGVTTYNYDALGRITKVIPPDGSSSANNTSIVYSLNCVTVTDPASKSTGSCSDGLGRTTIVGEDPASRNYQTVYAYDPLGNLLAVTQKGDSPNDSSKWRVRNFFYDFLSRLTQSSTPEGGSVNYNYNSSGDLLTRVAPAPNQTGSSTVTTTYAWDALHRLTSKTYSDGTPTAIYYYDQQAPWGWNLSYYKGRLTTAGTGGATPTANLYNFDPTGRIILREQCQPTNCSAAPSLHAFYTYNLLGSPTSLEFGVNGVWTRTISYAYDTAGRLTTVTSSLVDSQHPATLFSVDSSNGYFPHGGLRKATLPNGLTESIMYNKTLQPCRVEINSAASGFASCTDSVPSGNVLDLTYGYNSGSSNNGNVASWSATGNQTFNRSYSYDSLNRLSTMSDTASSQPCKGVSWTVDAWGNLTDQTQTNGTCLGLHVGVGTNNRLGSPYQYDSAGNMTTDGTHTYTYDAEGRLTKVDNGSTATYTYDAEGNRVLNTSNGTQSYIYGIDGRVIADVSSTGNWNTGYVYAGVRLVAQYRDGTTYSIFGDHLGSARLITKLDKSVYDSLDFMPFGAQIAGGSGTTYKFTGDARDSESNLDHTFFRTYSSGANRWITPDPGDLATASLGNPQSWNRYAYTQNTPMNAIDPTGAVTFMCKYMDGACLFNTVGTGGGPTCTADGVDLPCWMAQSMLSSGSAVRCTNNNCGVGTSTPFRCIDEACGYMSNEYASTHANSWDGVLYSDSEWKDYVNDRADAQRQALADAISEASDSQHGANWDYIYENLDPYKKGSDELNIQGGNVDFRWTGDESYLTFVSGLDWSKGGCPLCRYGAMDAIHYIHSMFHLDTASPIWGQGRGLFLHAFVDVLLGNINPSVPIGR